MGGWEVGEQDRGQLVERVRESAMTPEGYHGALGEGGLTMEARPPNS